METIRRTKIVDLLKRRDFGVIFRFVLSLWNVADWFIYESL